MGKSKNGTHAKSWAGKQVFTTGEAAEICKVSQQTIIRCFDSGRLQGFRVPGSRFRRIPRADLIRFMKANDIPLDILQAGDKVKVLIVDDDPEIVEVLEDALGGDERYEIRSASTGYDAGMLTESFRPDVVLLDYMLPDINGNLVCQRIRENEALSGTRIIVVSGVVKREEVSDLLEGGADDFIQKPFNVAQLLEKVEALTSTEKS